MEDNGAHNTQRENANIGMPLQQAEPVPFNRRKDIMTTALAIAESAIERYPNMTRFEADILIRTFTIALPLGRW